MVCSSLGSFTLPFEFQRALEINPNFAAAHGYLNWTVDYSDALRLKPELSEARADRGTLYEGAGQKDLALDDYNEAIRLNPNLTRALYRRGMTYMGQAAYAKARSDFREAIRSFPNFEAAFA